MPVCLPLFLSLIYQVSTDNQSLNLTGALVNHEDLSITIQFLYGVLNRSSVTLLTD